MKCQVLSLGDNSSMRYSRLEDEWLESGLVEKDLGMLVESRLNTGQCVPWWPRRLYQQ